MEVRRLLYWICVQVLLVLKVHGDIDICEKGKPADVVFLLDASNSIWNPDFLEQLNFVQSVIDYFPIGEENIKVAAATFSDDVFPQFPLNQYSSKTALKLGVADIFQDMGMYTRTYEAIKFMREEFFQKGNGAREGVFKIGIVITDGRSYDTAITAKEAALAKEEGIHMFAIGVGDRVDMEELLAIASKPANHYRFLVDSYRGLQRIIKFLAIKACTVTDPPPSTTTVSTTTPLPTTTTPLPTTTKPPVQKLQFESRPIEMLQSTTPGNNYHEFRQVTDVYNGPNSGDPDRDLYDLGSKGATFTKDGCYSNQPMDLTFVIDSKKGGTAHKKKIWKFIRSTISNLNVNDGDMKINFVYDCLDTPGFHLDEHSTKAGLLQAFKPNATSKSTGDLLNIMTDKLTNPDFNSIVERKKVGVFVTDGESGGLENTLREAQNAKLGHNIKLYGVGITDDVNDVEMNALVSCPVENHLTLVSNHNKLRGFNKQLARNLCEGVESM